jgi:hypothetical protein
MPKEFYGHPDFYKFVDELKELHSEKNKQYATQDDPLANFKRASRLCEKLFNPNIKNKPLAYAFVLMSKQIDCVAEIIGEGKTDTVEELKDKLRDIAIYSILMMILEEENVS